VVVAGGNIQPIGRVVATEQLPASPHQFHFWTEVETPLGIGAIVRVEGAARMVYAVVVDAKAYSDLADPLHEVRVAAGVPGAHVPPTRRTEIRLWTAAVLRQVPEEPLQPVPLADVFLASEEDVQVALRMESYVQGEAPTGIPIGMYATGGLTAPVYLDANFLLGPESAHLNISGVSGLATKTSAVEFLLKSVFTHFPSSKGRVAAVCFNVKGPDLCFLDQPTELPPEDLEMYAGLGIDPTPFDGAHYFAPFKADGININTLRSHPDLIGSVQPLVWGLREVLDYHSMRRLRRSSTFSPTAWSRRNSGMSGAPRIASARFPISNSCSAPSSTGSRRADGVIRGARTTSPRCAKCGIDS
jgi:hypothetical protein